MRCWRGNDARRFHGHGRDRPASLALAARRARGGPVVTQPDKPAGRRQELRAPAVKQLALAEGVPILQPARLRAPEAVAEVVALRADVIVVMAYGQILPRAVLDAGRLACLNLHASILPKYRGAAPIQAAIEAGDAQTGVTVMHMAEGLDTGDILLIRETPILRRDTGGSLHDRLALVAADALAAALPLVERGAAPRLPQNEAEASYAAKSHAKAARSTGPHRLAPSSAAFAP